MKSDSLRKPLRAGITVFCFLAVLSILVLVLNCDGLASRFLGDNRIWQEVKNHCSELMDEAVSKVMGINPQNLLEKITSENMEDRLKALQTISQATSRQTINLAMPAIIDAMLHDEEEIVRIEAAQALNLLGATAYDAKPAMLHALGDESGDIRTLAADFLVRMGSEVRKDLLPQLRTTDPKRFAAAALAVSQIKTEGYREFLPRLTALSKHSDNCVRTHAVSALGNFRDSSVLETLRRSLRDPDAHVRARAVFALEKVTKQPQQLLDAIQPLLEDESPTVRQNVVHIMGRLQDNDAALALITQHLSHENDPATNQLTSRIKYHLECLKAESRSN